jgi:hypothetical protein
MHSHAVLGVPLHCCAAVLLYCMVVLVLSGVVAGGCGDAVLMAAECQHAAGVTHNDHPILANALLDMLCPVQQLPPIGRLADKAWPWYMLSHAVMLLVAFMLQRWATSLHCSCCCCMKSESSPPSLARNLMPMD